MFFKHSEGLVKVDGYRLNLISDNTLSTLKKQSSLDQDKNVNNKVADGRVDHADKATLSIFDLVKKATSSSNDDAAREARLSEIKASIKDGSYVINSEQVASKMINFDQLFDR